MNKILKIFVFIILNLNFYSLAISKPLPPGSGSGDVPANILILLDSSLSMNNKLGDGLPDVAASTIDTRNGNKIKAINFFISIKFVYFFYNVDCLLKKGPLAV